MFGLSPFAVSAKRKQRNTKFHFILLCLLNAQERGPYMKQPMLSRQIELRNIIHNQVYIVFLLERVERVDSLKKTVRSQTVLFGLNKHTFADQRFLVNNSLF